MAFDPGFATNRRFYVDYIDKTTLNTVVATYQASASQPNIADPATAQTVLTVAQPEFANHKAGWIGFRPGENANLYIGTGDGGSANDPQNRAQNLNENLGKILRVDVSADRLPADPTRYGYGIPTGNITGGNPEIYAYGLRNPYRDSFDRETGTFYIADVGQNQREEINIGAAGANYGWRKFEGTHLNFPNDPALANHTPPIFEYNHKATCGRHRRLCISWRSDRRTGRARISLQTLLRIRSPRSALPTAVALLNLPTALPNSSLPPVFRDRQFDYVIWRRWFRQYLSGELRWRKSRNDHRHTRTGGLGHDAGGHGPDFSMGAASRASSGVGNAAVVSTQLPAALR